MKIKHTVLLCFSMIFLIFFFYTTSKPSTPRISLITSVYDGDEFIEGFFQDITQQTIFNECELIMINANSPGHEEPIIKSYMAKYPNIIYLKLSEDPGLYGVWNLGIKKASAQFISNANLDDRSNPKALEIQVKHLERHPKVDLVFTGYLITEIPNETFSNHHASAVYNPKKFSIKKSAVVGPRPVWRKSLHQLYGFFDETFRVAGDTEMWMRAVSKGAVFHKLPKVTTLYYQNPKGLSTDIDQEKTLQRNMELFRLTRMHPDFAAQYAK